MARCCCAIAREDFAPIAHARGDDARLAVRLRRTRAWYTRAERLYRVRGALGGDPTEPPHSDALSAFRPCRTSRRSRDVRERLKRVGLHPFPLPLGVDIEAWLKRAPTPWDAFPDTRTGKMDAETCGLAAALAHPNVELRRAR